MANQAAVDSALESIVGRSNVVLDKGLESYAVDGCTPNAAIKPGSYEEVTEVLRYAASERTAVIPWGGGTHMHIGNIPRAYDIALDLTRLNAVIEHEAADLTVTCQAGITLESLEASLALDRQTVPFDPALPVSATAGGLVASAASGATRMTYGAPRDFTIGMRVITADGRTTRAGGKVVKNVAGYDLCKLYGGSRGTLGVIVETTFKVLPLPAVTNTMTIGFQEQADACAFAASIYRRGLSVRGMTLHDTDASPLSHASCALSLDIAGTEGSVERTVSEVQRFAAGDEGMMPLETDPPARPSQPNTITVQMTVKPTDLPSLIAGIEAISSNATWTAFPVLGILRTEVPTGSRSLLDQESYVCGRLRGALTIERCPPELKHEIDVFGPEPASIALMRSVKSQFDPGGVLSPGRFLGRI